MNKSKNHFSSTENDLKHENLDQLKKHLSFMKTELNETNKQVKLLKKKKNQTSDWNEIEVLGGKSIDELKKEKRQLKLEIKNVQKQIKSKSKILLLTELTLLPVLFLLLIVTGVGPQLYDSFNERQESFQSRYFVENLKGDTLHTWKSWRLVEPTMNVNIIVPNTILDDKAQVVIDSISSMEAIELDDSLTNKGLQGTSSLYYLGWKGAINDALSNEISTKYQLPLDFNIMKSNKGEGDIIITLSNLRDIDGYTGYTKSIVDGNEILKSFITIYDVGNLSDEQLGTIARHEFGHALGLGHSTAPEDLMAPTIDMTYPFISECNVSGIIDLYNGNEGSKTVCEK